LTDKPASVQAPQPACRAGDRAALARLHRYRLGPAGGALIVLLGLILFVPASGSRVSLTRHEVLTAQPAREMVRFNHWSIPTFAGKPRLVKPPATAWTIALLFKVTGDESERVVRFPSALAATIIALALAMLGARFAGRNVGLIAGLAQLTFYYTLMQGRLAEADMPLAACVTVAMYQFAVACVPAPTELSRPTLTRNLLFFFAAAIGFCFKGPIAWGFIFPACALYALLQQDPRHWRFLLNPIGILLLLTLSAAWPIAAYGEHPAILQVWKTETFSRAVGDLAGEEYHIWWFYAPMVIALLLPWLPWTLIGLVRAIQRRDDRTPLGRFLIAWFAPGFVMLTIIAWKHKHYVIPIMPALTLPTAIGIAWWLREARRTTARNFATFILLFVSGCATAVVMIEHYVRVAAGPIALLVGVLAVAGLAVLYASKLRSRRAQIATFFATALVVSIATQFWVMPHYDLYAGWTALAKRSAARIPPGATIFMLGMPEAQAAFYLNFPMQRCDTAEQVRATFAPMQQGAYALTPESLVGVLEDLGRVERLDAAHDLRLPGKAQETIYLVYFSPVRTGIALTR
jgi:4-amino-4-deoxy-L-arabinose transferase-like glycosyltransferase